MKLFYKKQNLINELKKARQIKAEQGFKVSLYERLAEIDSNFLAKFTLESGLPVEFAGARLFYRASVFAPLLLVAAIIILAGGGVGITFASQTALPGDILYPIKIASEKTRVVLASDDDEKTQLHFEFSSRRLEEVAELAKDSSSDPKLAEIAVENYKKELNEGQIVLFSNKSWDESERAAELLVDVTHKNKESIIKIGAEAKNYKIADSLKNAWEDTVEHNDKAVLIILRDDVPQATKKVINKIAEVEGTILETEEYLSKKKEKGIDIVEAEAEINSAKGLIGEAKALLNQTEYENAFSKAKEAQKTAAVAKAAVEHLNGDEDKEKLEMFRRYYDDKQLEQGGT